MAKPISTVYILVFIDKGNIKSSADNRSDSMVVISNLPYYYYVCRVTGLTMEESIVGKKPPSAFLDTLGLHDCNENFR